LTKTREDFMPDVGGFLDGIDGDITGAKFEIASGAYADKVKMGGDEPGVVIVLTVESPELNKPVVQTYSVGDLKLWNILDGGTAIKNVKNPDKVNFRKGSMAMYLVEAMAIAMGGDVAKGQELFAKGQYYMTEAAFYTGLSFGWTTQKRDIPDGKTTNVPLPETFLGQAKNGAKGEVKDGTEGAVADEVLDAILVASASGLDNTGIKTFAVKDLEIHSNPAYMKSVVSGSKLKELEDAGKITKDPATGKYI